jgi:hypothetical protein
MQAAFPPPDYYGASAPPYGHQLAPNLLAWKARRPGGRRRFPRSPSADRRVRHPAIPRQPRHQLRRGPSPWPPQPSASSGYGSDRRAINRGHLLHTDPYPPGLSRLIAYGASSLVPRVYLPVSLARPGPSGSTGPPCRCQGCSHPSQRSLGQAALSFTRPPRQPGVGVLSPPLRTDGASWRTIASMNTAA